MSNSTTATVETLTAEVRTLMVGSRQVTLSVYNQLDRVSHSQIEPFGRVNPKNADRSDIWVVGRDRADGSLVRARTPHLDEEFDGKGSLFAAAGRILCDALRAVPDTLPDESESVIRDATEACARLRHAGFFGSLANSYIEGVASRILGGTFGNGKFRLPGNFYTRIASLSREMDAGCAKTSGGPFDSRAIAVSKTYREAEAVAQYAVARVRKAWSELPLIVLAGLR